MNEDDIQQKFTRRAIILGGIQGLLLTSVMGRMYQLQIASGQHYQTLSDKNRIHSRLIAPSRGQILDRQGSLLATNIKSYSAVIIRDQAEDWPKKINIVKEMLNISDDDLRRIKTEIRQKPRFIPVTLKDNLTWEEVAQLELHLLDITGVTIEEGQSRSYLYPTETCHLLGYIATPSEKDLDGSHLLQLPGFRMGKSGVEKFYDVSLRGQAGIKQVEVNAVRRVVRELSSTPSIPGADLHLTIDLSLQRAVHQRLSTEESAAAVILDIHTGHILSFVSSPGYDNNLFVHGIPKKDWQDLLEHPRHALMNKVISGQYAPGSTFKMIVALAALESKVIEPHTQFFCGGHLALGDHKFHCHRKGGHGSLALEDAIAHSCDVYFFHVASLLGIDPIAKMALRFGLGRPTGIGLPGEKAGLVPSRSWKSIVMGKNWQMGETYNASIGQGYILATPLQLAVMTAQLANGGKTVQPTLTSNPGSFLPQPIGVNPQHLAFILSGMNKVVNMPGATAYQARITLKGFEMAGKTGSTQVRRITKQDRHLGQTSTANRPWHHREHAMFVGYAPVHQPRYAAVVLVEHGMSGGKVAAPIGRDILMAAQMILGETSS